MERMRRSWSSRKAIRSSKEDILRSLIETDPGASIYMGDVGGKGIRRYRDHGNLSIHGTSKFRAQLSRCSYSLAYIRIDPLLKPGVVIGAAWEFERVRSNRNITDDRRQEQAERGRGNDIQFPKVN